MTNKIIPRNLTARAAYNVPGNPPSTRPESGVANCYPGLEYDHRNLDRRFFPGLVLEYVSPADTTAAGFARAGAHLLALDLRDPELRPSDPALAARAKALRDALNGDAGTALGTAGARWFVHSIQQAGKIIELARPNGTPLDGAIVWRLVRSLRPAEVTLILKRRDDDKVAPVQLDGWRRRYTDRDSGVISLSFQPGELTQSLCSPWMHDFRDCACTYWASNHPDIVLAALPPGEPTLPSGMAEDALRGATRVDWLRADSVWSATSLEAASNAAVEQQQMSHFEINQRWQDLAIVLENREVGDVYIPRSRRNDYAQPYRTPVELRDQLLALAGLEHLAILLYLYGRYSVITRAEAQRLVGNSGKWATLADDVEFVRHELLDVAASEMQHLRWANLLLAALAETRLIPGWSYTPAVLPPALEIPGAGRLPTQPAELRPLDAQAIALFVAIEEPSGYIDGRYARATATLLLPEYPRHLYEVASTIVRDGEQHFLKFRDVQLVLGAYGQTSPVYLRALKPGNPESADVKAALGTYKKILDDLVAGYSQGSVENRKQLAVARELMFQLDEQAEALARNGIGLPYLSLFAPPKR